MTFGVGLAAAVGAALVFGWYLFFYKRYLSHHPTSVYVVVSNAFALLAVAPILAVTADGPAVPAGADLTTLAVVLGVIAVATLALLAFVAALQRGEVSYVTPISKVIPVFVLPVEVGLLNEHLTPVQVLGVVLATAAVYLANYRPGELVEPLRRAATSRPAQLALLSAAGYALVDVGRRVILQELSVPITTWVPVIVGGIGLVLLPFAARSWDGAAVRADLPKFALAGAVVGPGEFVVSLAFDALPASIASPVVNLQAVVAVVLGGLVLGEDYFRTRLGAAALAVVGVTLITLG